MPTRRNYIGSVAEQQKAAAKQDAIMNFMLNATKAEIANRVDSELDGTTALELRSQIRKLFKVVFLILAYILRRIDT